MTQARQPAHYRGTFAVLLIGITGYSLLQSLVLPVLPTIQHSLHTSQATVTWVVTVNLLAASVFTPIFGRVGDMAGKERMFLVALGALALGSLLAGLATSIGVMIVARAIQGVGGGVVPLAFGIIRDEFPREKVVGAIGITAALVAVGAGVGIVIAGPIIDVLDFHWLFWIPMIMVLVAGVTAYFLVPKSPVRSPGRINWGAAALLSGWLVALLVGVSEGSVWGWTSPQVLGLFVLAVLLGVWWIRVELKSSEPLIDMRMMRLRAVWTTNLVAFLFGVGLYSGFAFLPAFVQAPPSAGYGFGATVTESGFFLLPLAVTMFVGGMISGYFSRKIGSRTVLFVGSAVCIIPFVMLAFAHSQRWEIYLATGLLGAGFGLAFSATSNLIVEAVPAEQTGVASGMNANIRTIGGSIGAAVMASIVTSGVRAGALPKESGYEHGFATLAVSAALAAAATFLVPKFRRAGARFRDGDGPADGELTSFPAVTLTGHGGGVTMRTDTAPVGSGRPLRRDAAQHRERLLDAAAQVFAASGLSASVEEIARVAGVGMGTLYRRFPTKEALIDELVRQQLSDLIEAATAARPLPGGVGLEAFLWRTGELLADRCGCLSRLWTEVRASNLADEARRLISELLADSQHHGRLRPDVDISDISLVLWSLIGVIGAAGPAAPQAWRRTLELLLAGLRRTDGTVVSPAPVAGPPPGQRTVQRGA